MTRTKLAAAVVAAALMLVARPTPARAHCDTLDGPVVRDARLSLDTADVTSTLKWVRADQEAEVRSVFAQALAVRRLGPQARDLADRHFFETLVRLHRESEGEPFAGLKPAGVEVAPGTAAADHSLEGGSPDELVRLLAAAVEEGVRERFGRVLQARKHAGESVEQGRAYVAAYVELMHYAERLHGDATGGAPPEEHAAAASEHRH
jgi:Family of unknown function (DUF6448)